MSVSIAKTQACDLAALLPANMQTFPIPWLARHFATSNQFWISLVDSGHLRALDLRSPGTSKSMLRIPRKELLEYLKKASF